VLKVEEEIEEDVEHRIYVATASHREENMVRENKKI
jgi:hypothetical protein